MAMFRTVLAWVVMTLTVVEQCVGQEPVPSEEEAKSSKLLKSYYRHKAKEYDFRLDAEGKQKLTLQPVVMTWSGHDYQAAANAVSANSGDVYIWTHEGRAVVAGGIGSVPVVGRRDFFHEFHVLTEQVPQATMINALPDVVWRPQAGGVPKRIPGAKAPTETSPSPLARNRRLVQMRELAREFSGSTVKPDDPSGKARLRMLTTPIYRLDSDELAKGKHKVIDGAVFVFTGPVGTDPEMLLSIECRELDSGFEWTYFPAAMTYLEMWLEHRGKEVWHTPNYFTEPRLHQYFTSIVDRADSLEEIRARLDSADAGDRKQNK